MESPSSMKKLRAAATIIGDWRETKAREPRVRVRVRVRVRGHDHR